MANKEEILQAIGNGRLKQVLKGECGYSIGFDEWSAALVPTDWTQVLPLLNVYARQVGSTYVEHYFENTIIELLSGDAEDIFVAIGAFYTQLLFERDGDFTYSIQREKIASIAKTSIAQNQENLQTCKSWYGAYSDNGLMDEINRYRKLMKKNFNLDLGNIESTHSVEIFTELSKKILRGAKIPHSTSQPVIYEEGGKYFLAVFVFFFTHQDIEAGEVDRPTHWAVCDLETGEILKEYETKDKDFSDAPYDVKYNVRADGQYDTSKEYYDKAFAVLDSVREKLLKEGHLYRAEYDYYLNMILKNIPKDYQRFFRDLSV